MQGGINIKKVIFLIILIILSIGVIYIIVNDNKQSLKTQTSQTSGNNKQTNVIKISERAFMQQMGDIYVNYKEYEGKKVSYEGYMEYEEDIVIVARKYYCCGYDAYPVGLEIEYENTLPEENEWVRVEGIIDLKEDQYGKYPFLKVTDIEILETRGQEIIMY